MRFHPHFGVAVLLLAIVLNLPTDRSGDGDASRTGTSWTIEIVERNDAFNDVTSFAYDPRKGEATIANRYADNLYEAPVRVGNASAFAGAIPVRTRNSTAFTLHVQGGPAGPRPSSFPWMTAAAVGGAVLLASAALLALQHTRLAKEDLLQKKVRHLTYETIRQHPGATFTVVRDAVGLQNGVAAYHLGVLEKQGLIHSERGRCHRWYYPNGDVSLWRDLPLSPLQSALLEKVGQAPGIGIRELARSLNCHHGSVAYNVKGLARDGLLRTQRTGRRVECFPMDERGAA